MLYARAARNLDQTFYRPGGFVSDKPTDPHRFKLLPRRWVVEWSFACDSRNRRLARDYERHARSVEALVRLAMIRIMLQSLTCQTTVPEP